MFAHSLKFALPRTMAPAARRRSTINASRGATTPLSANEPAVVVMRFVRVDVAFDDDGDAMEGTAQSTGAALIVELPCERARVRVGLEHRPQRGTAAIDLVDAGEILLDDAGCGERAGAHLLLQLRDGRLVELEGGGSTAIGCSGRLAARAAGRDGCRGEL
jgi:hypothetical protein